jgi:cytochrome P450
MVAHSTEIPEFLTGMTHLTRYDDVSFALRSADMVIFRDEYVGPFLGGTLTALNGPAHFERRRLESPIFATPALRSWTELILRPMLDEFFDDARAERDADGNIRLDLVRAGLYLLVRVGAQIAGLDVGREREQVFELLDYVETFSVGAGFEWVRGTAKEKQPIFEATMAKTARFREEFFEPALRRRRELVDSVRRGDANQDELPRDVLTTMLLHHNDMWDDSLLFREVALYMHASIRTTTRAVYHSVDEILKWIATHPEDAGIVENTLALRGAVGEVLRIHPLLPAMVRRATARVTLPSGLVVEEGTDVGLLFAEANRDPAIFGPDADEFNPARYRSLPPTVNPYGFAFGGGPHMCMGRRMAAGDGKGDSASTAGTITTIAQAFLRAGIERDTERSIVPNNTTYYDDYISYPAVLTKL